VIVGGICNVLHGVSLLTQYVDLFCRFEAQNLQRIASAVADLSPVHRMTPQRLPFELTDQLVAGLKNLYLRTDLGVVDCLSEVAGLGPYDHVLKSSVEIQLSIGVCRMLSLEGLIRSKEAMGRPQDLAALRQLLPILERNRNAMDGKSH
jgi:hypothetical protein